MLSFLNVRGQFEPSKLPLSFLIFLGPRIFHEHDATERRKKLFIILVKDKQQFAVLPIQRETSRALQPANLGKQRMRPREPTDQ